VCTAKHFPGHGSADQDSHGHLPKIDVGLAQLLERDLIPYRMLIREGIPAVMTGHLAFPRILGSLTPASLSPFFLQSILRDRLGFEGLIITDDMEMEGALSGGLDTPGACRKALEAGNDMVLISHSPVTQERTWKSLIAAMRVKAFRSSIKQSVNRILSLKIRSFRGRSAVLSPDAKAVDSLVPAPGARDFFFQTSARAATLVSSSRIPYVPRPRERILICGQFPEFLAEGARRYPRADTWLFPFNPFYSARSEDVAAMRAKAARYDTIIFCLANYNSLGVLQALRNVAAKVMVVAALSPVYLAEAPWVTTAVAVYGDGTDSFRAAYSVLAGELKASGTLPLDFSLEGLQ
jgi:beta-N-acetylhexosaminidase